MKTFSPRFKLSTLELHGPRISPSDQGRRWRSSAPPASPIFFRSDGRPVHLDNLFARRSCFLVCGGPSAATHNLERLRARGILTMCINNSWLMVKPDLWIGVDNPAQFADIGWKDPTILKFTGRHSISRRIAFKQGTSKHTSRFSVEQMPSVFFFDRLNGFDPQTFFTSPGVPWGNTDKEGADAVGVRNSRSTMIAALRVLAHLGVGDLYIVGADFQMPLDMSLPAYGFQEGKWIGGRQANNKMYDSLNRRFAALWAFMQETNHPMKIWNCTPGGNLTAFPRLSYDEGVDRAGRECAKAVDGYGWYIDEKKRPGIIPKESPA